MLRFWVEETIMLEGNDIPNCNLGESRLFAKKCTKGAVTRDWLKKYLLTRKIFGQRQ